MLAQHAFKCHPASVSVIFALLVNLTFSSIPPLMTGSGSGPVGMKITQESVVRLTENNSFCLSLSVGTSVMSWYLQSCTIRAGSSTLLDQESFCSSPFIPPTPTLLHSTGMSRSSIIHTWFIFYEMVLLLVLYNSPPRPIKWIPLHDRCSGTFLLMHWCLHVAKFNTIF